MGVRHQLTLAGGFFTGLGFIPEPLDRQPYRYTRKSSSPESVPTLQANLQESPMFEKHKHGKDWLELVIFPLMGVGDGEWGRDWLSR